MTEDTGSTAIGEATFLDAQVFVSNVYDFTNPSFEALKKHVASGRLRLVLTDITVGEVRANIVASVNEEMAGFRKVAGRAKAIKVAGISDVNAAIDALSPDKVVAKHLAAFEGFLKETKAEILDASDGDASAVFEQYFAGHPPFGSREDKKVEFPDAFVAQALIEWTAENDRELLAVTGDSGLSDALRQCDEIRPLKDLTALLDHVASDNKKLAKFLREQLVAKKDALISLVDERFRDRSFYVKDENGDAELDTTEFTIVDDPEIIDVDIPGKTATVRVAFSLNFSAYLSFVEPGSGWYDAETDEAHFVDRAHEHVTRRARVVADVRVLFNGLEPDDFQIESVALVRPSGSAAVFIRTDESMENYK